MFDLFGAQKKTRAAIDAMPVADIAGEQNGPTLLVTAGMDGDEYTPIEAAYRAAELYRGGNFSGRLIILPIVNIPGFDARVSHNPLDGKFPKYCIPGNVHGSMTQRLMHHIVQTYARGAHMWLDLHSGAPDETALSCLWNDVTGVIDVDARGQAFTAASGVAAAVRGQAGPASHALAKHGCAYVLAESEDESEHRAYIERAMQTVQMLPGTSAPLLPKIFRKTRDMHSLTEEIGPGELVLWHKLYDSAKTGERVGEIAYDEQTS